MAGAGEGASPRRAGATPPGYFWQEDEQGWFGVAEVVFLCGVFAHPPVLEAVLGRPMDGVRRVPAVLGGAAIVELPDIDGAGLVARADAEVRGWVAELSGDDVDRLRYVAQVYGFAAETCQVSDGQGARPALTFFARGAVEAADWNEAEWRARVAPRMVRALIEIVAQRHCYSAARMAARLGAMRMRAAAWQRARARPGDGARDLARDVVVHRHEVPYLNFFSVHEMDLQYRRYDGTMSAVLNRGALMLGEAVAVLPYDPVRDAVVLVEQFRAPLYMGGARDPWIWEPIAGLVDAGESAGAAAHREAREEAGVTLSRLVPLGPVYSSTGAVADYLNFYIGLCDVSDVGDGNGLDAEGEDIRTRVIGYDDLMARIDAGEFMDLPLLTLALWLARHRTRLREMD